jgi:hypothetical protein
MTLFFKGLAFGFVLAATVGPMWVLCFGRTIRQGALAGFVSGMGIAVADGLYDLRAVALEHRKALLARILSPSGRIRLTASSATARLLMTSTSVSKGCEPRSHQKEVGGCGSPDNRAANGGGPSWSVALASQTRGVERFQPTAPRSPARKQPKTSHLLRRRTVR